MYSRIIFCLMLSTLSLFAESKIIETASVSNFYSLIDRDVWLVIDLDNTTFEGSRALGHTEWFYDKAGVLMKEGMTLDEATKEIYPEWIEVQKICPVKPVERAFVESLRLWQDKGIVIIGLTHRQPSLADSTIRQLSSIGLCLNKTAPHQESFVVPADTPTLFTEGVLFTGEFNKKGEIFKRFLTLIGQKPKKVVFVDDKRSHVEDVGHTLIDLGIDYLGIHYKATEHVEKVYFPHIAAFQLKMLNQIMSNEAAVLLMERELE